MSIEKHNATKSLRKIIKEVKDLYPHLDPAELICCACRKKISLKHLQLKSQQKSPLLSRSKHYTFHTILHGIYIILSYNIQV